MVPSFALAMLLFPKPVPAELGCLVIRVRVLTGTPLNRYLCVIWGGGFAFTGNWTSPNPPTLDQLRINLDDQPERWSELFTD